MYLNLFLVLTAGASIAVSTNNALAGLAASAAIVFLTGPKAWRIN